jgi:hypothetical protein
VIIAVIPVIIDVISRIINWFINRVSHGDSGASTGSGSGDSTPANPPPDPEPNKYNHIFNKPQHDLGDFLDSFHGDQESAFNAVQNAGQNYAAENGLTGINEFTVNVNGFDITVRGAVIDGFFWVGTFFKP